LNQQRPGATAGRYCVLTATEVSPRSAPLASDVDGIIAGRQRHDIERCDSLKWGQNRPTFSRGIDDAFD